MNRRKAVKRLILMKTKKEKIKIILHRLRRIYDELPQLIEDLENVKNDVTKEVIKNHIKEMEDEFKLLKETLNKLERKRMYNSKD